MMKSPTSPIRFRNAVGALLALSAIFAVIITTFSLPGDRTTAQVPDATTAVEARAAAWWNALETAEARTNALFGKDYDHDIDSSDDVNQGDSEGRQLPPEASGQYSALESAGTAASGTPPTGGEIGKDNVNPLVDGSADANTPDIYAVGEGPGVQNAIRGFQSVELWWSHLTCVEARTAVGEDKDGLTLDTDTDTDGNQIEESAVCDANLNEAGDTIAPSPKAYAEVKSMVDSVGQAILGLDSPGSASTNDIKRAAAWWDTLEPQQRAAALYGLNSDATAPTIADTGGTTVTASVSQIAGRDYGEITSSLTFRIGADDLPLSDSSKELVDGVKALINDRWQWVYHMGGMNEMNLDEVVYWWNSIGHTQRRIAVGADNEPQAVGSETAAGYSMDWDDLQDDPVSDAGQTRQVRAFEAGRAILDLDPLPKVAAWWNTLDDKQMVNVVYGSPLATENADTNDATPETDVAHVNDRMKFQKMYDGLSGAVIYADLPTATTNLLERHGTASAPGFDVDGSGGDPDSTEVDHDGDETTPIVAETALISVKLIVDTLADELFDPPMTYMAWVRRPGGGLVDTSEATGGSTVVVADDNDFDWPYNDNNKPASVADWRESTDCRVMRIAVGQDNNYLDAAFDDPSTEVDESMDGAETSIYCKHFPGSERSDGTKRAIGDEQDDVLSAEAQMRVVEVGAALLGLTVTTGSDGTHAGRPSFNDPAVGDPLIVGTAQVGSTLTVDTSNIKDDNDGLGTFSYQWYSDGEKILGATMASYTLTAADAGATISISVSFTDGEGYPEVRMSPPSLATSEVTGSPGEISRIEPAIRSVTVSAGDTVTLSVRVYGLQGVEDNDLPGSGGITWSAGSGSLGEGVEILYNAPDSPGTYTVTASVGDGACQPDNEDDRASDCSAEFVVKVQRPAATPTPAPLPQNPPGEIPAILTDSDGNQYEVFTPEGGGTFTGEGFNLTAGAGVIPSGEFIGIRVEEAGPASNIGMTQHRYSLGGNMYTISAVDATGAVVTSYALNNPATVCVPLPDELRHNISSLALAMVNADNTLTILSASVRLGSSGTHVCGSLSSLPASVAVGSAGSPAPLPTPVPPTATPVPPETGGAAPSSSGMAVWALLLGAAIVTVGTFLIAGTVRGRRRKETS